MITGRLCTEFAVLLAGTAPCIDDGTEIYTPAGEFLADLVGAGQEEHGIFILRADEGLCFILCQFPAA